MARCSTASAFRAVDVAGKCDHNSPMSASARNPDSGAQHERVYRSLRRQIMHGEIPPGTALTLRGIAAQFALSMTPVREAARRLVAEGALTLSSSGRLASPELSDDRIEELSALRALLEPELAARALPRAYPALIDRLYAINATAEQMILRQDATGYIRSNLEFHRTLYLRAQAPAMLAMVETVWLQLGPTMRALYSSLTTFPKSGPQSSLRPGLRRPGHHRAIIAALKSADEAQLRTATKSDVTQGLRMLMV